MNLRARELTRTALMSSIICVMSLITIPLGPIPFTLQTFAVVLAGAALGPKYGAAAVAVYILIGSAGVPVFSGFTAGIGRLIGPTGGYLLAFPATAVLSGLGKGRPIAARISLAFLGLVVMYLVGAAQYAIVAGISFIDAAVVGILPFMVKDAISAIAATIVARGIERALVHAV